MIFADVAAHMVPRRAMLRAAADISFFRFRLFFRCRHADAMLMFRLFSSLILIFLFAICLPCFRY